MKVGKDGDKAMGPMFPRIHLNNTNKGGPRAPPRNKMALYEQLSIPSHRFSHLSPNPNSIQGNVSDGGRFLSQTMLPGDPHARQYSQHSNISAPSIQAEQTKKSDEDDFSVPIFTHPVPNKNQEKASTSNPSHYQYPLESQLDKDRGTAKHSPDREGENKNGEISENHNPSDDITACDPCNGTGRTVSLERGDSVSDDSVLDVVCEVDLMMPDVVVGVIGQKHFWKARRAIVNQQRVFAVQVFELHRLMKVQRSIAAAPHILLGDSSYVSKPTKPSPPKKLPLDNALILTPNDPKSLARDIECSAENTLEKISYSHSSQSVPLTNGSYSVTKPCLNQPQGHHWLIPVMSPSEGFVYKPYPGPGFGGQPCGPLGPTSMMANFFGPNYGVSAPTPPQYHFPSLPQFGYFPQYGMPVHVPGGGHDFSILPMEGQTKGPASDDGIGCQSSKVSNPSGKRVAVGESSGAVGQNVLSLFPVGSGNGATDSGSQDSGPEGPSRVIKVVSRNGVSASEHTARIFMSIQEERRQFDSVSR